MGKLGRRIRKRLIQRLVMAALASFVWALALAATDRPRAQVGPEQLAVIVNDSDPLSGEIGHYYQLARNIPPGNMIHVAFAPDHPDWKRYEFDEIRSEVEAQTPPGVQFYALTWAAPYRVGCMSITSAFTFGFDQEYCSARLCASTRSSRYFRYETRRPFDSLHIRPTMSIAATTFAAAKALIDRGVAADGTFPRGTAYLMVTGDAARMSRIGSYAAAARVARGKIAIQILKQDHLEGRRDVLAYFTGKERVPALETLRFRPGAVADHLTSFGGQLVDSPQMSALGWLEAGATGSYGTVVEPCNLPEKFPNPAVFLNGYLQGESLIEAYWKSVAEPGEGIFIGEPLATPYALRARTGD